jgi:hypothetical protein
MLVITISHFTNVKLSCYVSLSLLITMKNTSIEKESKGMTSNSLTSSSGLAAAIETALYPHRWKALGLLSLAQFLVILDTSIIGVALPTIRFFASRFAMEALMLIGQQGVQL